MKAATLSFTTDLSSPFKSTEHCKHDSTNKIISGFRKNIAEFKIRLSLAGLALQHYRNPMVILRVLMALDNLRKSLLGPKRIQKLVKVNNKYYWDLYMPGFPSRTFFANMEAEMKRVHFFKKRTNRFINVFISTTKKCALKCEHCFEWDVLNQREKLSLRDLRSLVRKFQTLGTSQIQLAGAEPLMRIKDIIALLEGVAEDSDFWILTSGFNLTRENAISLKKAGLMGVVVSLDHFDPAAHNQFRGHENSFSWAVEAVKNSLDAHLVTALSVCATREFVSELNLIRYMDFAKSIGVAFVQILEPKAAGHYAGKDVALSPVQEQLIERLMMKMNFESAYSEHPIIVYHGYHQRRVGCFAAGNRNLYVDTDGDMHACPFCQKKSGSALQDNIEDSIAHLQSRGCHSFNSFAE
ncbi:MAG TPA: radical SAM protein [Cyclobacteriaceae bacterium]|nr:radical SAM protein [Cyclobacteriaceae bacterium]